MLPPPNSIVICLLSAAAALQILREAQGIPSPPAEWFSTTTVGRRVSWNRNSPRCQPSSNDCPDLSPIQRDRFLDQGAHDGITEENAAAVLELISE